MGLESFKASVFTGSSRMQVPGETPLAPSSGKFWLLSPAASGDSRGAGKPGAGVLGAGSGGHAQAPGRFSLSLAGTKRDTEPGTAGPGY